MNLRLNIEDGGTATLDLPYGVYEYGTEVTLTADPSTDYILASGVGI